MKNQNSNITLYTSLKNVIDKINKIQSENEILIPERLLLELNNSDRYLYFIFENENESKAFMIVKDSIDMLDLEYIMVDKKIRKRKIATNLITSLVNYAKNNSFKKIMLEVRKNNIVAISFYEKNGFCKISERKNYYSAPQDDALIYEKVII